MPGSHAFSASQRPWTPPYSRGSTEKPMPRKRPSTHASPPSGSAAAQARSENPDPNVPARFETTSSPTHRAPVARSPMPRSPGRAAAPSKWPPPPTTILGDLRTGHPSSPGRLTHLLPRPGCHTRCRLSSETGAAAGSERFARTSSPCRSILHRPRTAHRSGPALPIPEPRGFMLSPGPLSRPAKKALL